MEIPEGYAPPIISQTVEPFDPSVIFRQTETQTPRLVLDKATIAESLLVPSSAGIAATILLTWLASLVTNAVVAALLAGLGATGAFLAVMLYRRRRIESAEQELRRARYLATHDELTGLPNRQGIIYELQQALRACKRNQTVVGVLFLDLDRFKSVNDSMGHSVGDELLRKVAERLTLVIRTEDVVGRFGGDEFVVICRGLLERASVERVAESVLEAFREPVMIGKSQYVTTPSIGLSTADKVGMRTPEDLLRDADTAMYTAKRTRTGVRVFDEQQRQVVIDRMAIERQLLPALEAGQFAVHYQPIVNAISSDILSFEALVRWRHPKHGLLSPARFLHVMEETGLMARLGELVLRESVAQQAMWNHNYVGADTLSIGVNVAERQLVDPRFPQTVAEILQWSGLPPEQLTLEITEDLIIEHLDDTLSVLHRLADLGVTLSIDDFGTGRSSLSYVKRLDMVDKLKIDRSFVTGIPDGRVDMAIIEAIISMADALKLSVVAEGVETEEQADVLRNLGVEALQGYLFMKPKSAEDLETAGLFGPRREPIEVNPDLPGSGSPAGGRVSREGDAIPAGRGSPAPVPLSVALRETLLSNYSPIGDAG